MSKEPEIERKLDPFEICNWMIDKVCSANFITHATISGKLDDETLRIALDALQARHPLLRVRILPQGRSGARFESGDVPKIPLRILDAPEDRWVAEAESELHATFRTEEGPLMRCILLRHNENKSTLILTFNHVIADGMSGVYLARDLIQAAGHVRMDRENQALISKLEPTLAMEDCLPKWAKGIRGAFRFLLFSIRWMPKQIRAGAPTMPKPDADAPLKKRKAQLVPRVLEPATVEKLIERARRENTTVHCALAAALMMAIAQEKKLQKTAPFILASDVNMRKYLTPPMGEDLGCFISGVGTLNWAGTQTDFWRLAEEIRTSMQKSLDRRDMFILGWFIRLVNLTLRLFGTSGTKAEQKYIDALQMGTGGLSVSNIGALDIESRHGNLKIEKLGFAASPSVWAPIAFLPATLEGRMTLNCVGMAPIYSREHAGKIVDKTIEIFKDNLSDSSPEM